MPNRKKRARRRQGGVGAMLPALIAVLAVAAAALAVVLIQSDPLAPEPADERLPYQYTSPISFGDNATPQPLMLGATDEPQATPTPVPTPAATEVPPLWGDPDDLVQPEPTAEAESEEADPNATESPEQIARRLTPTPMPGDYFLPIYNRALRTPDDRPMIAVTVDNCGNIDNMFELAETARRYGAKLTLFPIGSALMDHPAEFRSLYYDYGFELENYCYDADRLDYTLGDGELALQIWRQGIATSYILGRDYQQHFYRPKTRQSAVDQRTHFFLRKLKMLGVASYTYSYLYHDAEYLSKTLANGNIYQFDMSKESMAVFEDFLSEANRKGYKMVTMNELFGLAQNAMGRSLTIAEQTLPGMSGYQPSYYDLKLYNRAVAVYDIQARLRDLGYLKQVLGDHVADGIYGASTSVAVSEFQAMVGLAATGDADVETQKRLFAVDAPTKPPEVITPAPTIEPDAFTPPPTAVPTPVPEVITFSPAGDQGVITPPPTVEP